MPFLARIVVTVSLLCIIGFVALLWIANRSIDAQLDRAVKKIDVAPKADRER